MPKAAKKPKAVKPKTAKTKAAASKAVPKKLSITRVNQPKKIHVGTLADLAKIMHSLGVDISAHTKAVRLDEYELEKIEKEAESFLSPADKTKLKNILGDFIEISETLLGFEQILVKHTKPFIDSAMKNVEPNPIHIVASTVLPLNYPKIEKTKATHLLKDTRDLLMASFYYENDFFLQYKGLLKQSLDVVDQILKLEKKWGNRGGNARLEMLRLHDAFRKMVHEDIQYLFKEVANIYDLRFATIKYLREIDKQHGNKKFMQLAKDRKMFLNIYKGYIRNFNDYSVKLNNLYIRSFKV